MDALQRGTTRLLRAVAAQARGGAGGAGPRVDRQMHEENRSRVEEKEENRSRVAIFAPACHQHCNTGEHRIVSGFMSGYRVGGVSLGAVVDDFVFGGGAGSVALIEECSKGALFDGWAACGADCSPPPQCYAAACAAAPGAGDAGVSDAGGSDAWVSDAWVSLGGLNAGASFGLKSGGSFDSQNTLKVGAQTQTSVGAGAGESGGADGERSCADGAASITVRAVGRWAPTGRGSTCSQGVALGRSARVQYYA